VSEKFVSERNLRFLLHEVFDVGGLSALPRYAAHDAETADMVLDSAMRLGRERMRPCLVEMDRRPPVLEAGHVRVHPVVREFMRECGEAGWIGGGADEAAGGAQLPFLLTTAFRFVISAANYSLSVYPFLTGGAARLIETFGDDALRRTYLPPMLAGRWQGTMALTEPHAGSALADLGTTARPAGDSSYRVRGQKVFTSAGDHDGADNIVHLLLARIEGAPAGVRGISLFVVPRERPEADGRLVDNDVRVANLFHKMGYRGAPIGQLNFGEGGDCRAWLVGEPNRGLQYMFRMMNHARVDVGVGAAGIASAAYYASLDYAAQRPQGRPLDDRDPQRPPVMIWEHPDVRRMLLFQRAVVEGSLALLLQTARYADLAEAADGRERQEAAALLDLLTPVAKTWPSETGIQSVSAGLQCLGGAGYCDDYVLEQLYRDARIHPIHEGTTGIQALDLLGRKLRQDDGLGFHLFLERIDAAVEEARDCGGLDGECEMLEDAAGMLRQVATQRLERIAAGDPVHGLADATVFLEMFGLVAVGWQWLRQAARASRALAAAGRAGEGTFYRGKIGTCRYFFRYQLPRTRGLAAALQASDGYAADFPTDWLSD